MHRQTQYPYEVPAETDFLYASRFAYEALGLFAADLLATSTLVAGLACTATGPASLNVNIGPGRIYSFQTLEPTAWGVLAGVGGLPVDTNADHNILKQGLFRDTTAFPCPAPGTVGQSINYLIEASFLEVDAVPLSLPFVSATSPYPPIAPSTLNTVRQDKCIITVKAGVAATTGTQTTPSVDSGNVGLWVVTVANGQTTITSGNISLFAGAPFFENMQAKLSQTTADLRYLQISNARIRLTANTTFYVSTTGNDGNSGLTVGSPWLTIQHAIAFIQTRYDMSGGTATIQLADGTYTEAVAVNSPFVGVIAAGGIVINGNAVTPTNVVLTSAGSTFSVANNAAVQLQNLQIQTTATGVVGAVSSNSGFLLLGAGIVFGPSPNAAHMVAVNRGIIALSANYKISGNCQYHMYGQDTSNFILGGSISTITLTGSPVFSVAFIRLVTLSSININSSITGYTGAFGTSGKKYQGELTSVFNTNGGGASFFPGTNAGTVDATSVYA